MENMVLSLSDNISNNEGNNTYLDIVFFVSVDIVNDDFAYSIDKFYLLKYKFSTFSFKWEQNFLCLLHDLSSKILCIFKLLLAFIYDKRNVIFKKR